MSIESAKVQIFVENPSTSDFSSTIETGLRVFFSGDLPKFLNLMFRVPTGISLLKRAEVSCKLPRNPNNNLGTSSRCRGSFVFIKLHLGRVIFDVI